MSKAGTTVGEGRTPKTRRRWARQEKRRIVEETFAAGASIAQVARAHEVNANQVHSWRRLYERGHLDGAVAGSALLPVRVVPDSMPVVRLSTSPALAGAAQKPRRSRAVGVIQIEVDRGRLRIEGAADPLSLRVVLESLLG